MYAARLATVVLAPSFRNGMVKVNTQVCRPAQLRQIIKRNYADESRQWTRTSRRRTLKEVAMQPTEGTPFAVGSAAVAGGAVCGLGALCYYGLGLSKNAGIVDQSILWPQYVRDRVRDTYMYFGSSLVFTAASAVTLFRSPTVMRFMASNSLMATFGAIAALVATSTLVHSIPYQPGFGPKQMAWMLHSGVMGAVLAPMCLLGGPLLIRAAWYTAGIVGGLSAVAACAPSDKFLTMGGPLAIGLGVVFASSIGSMFLSPATALGAGLYSISLYGGLLVFSGFLLYDTQRIVRSAETHPQWAIQPYDPVEKSLSIYMDTINIFVRIATLLAGGGGNRRK